MPTWKQNGISSVSVFSNHTSIDMLFYLVCLWVSWIENKRLLLVTLIVKYIHVCVETCCFDNS